MALSGNHEIEVESSALVRVLLQFCSESGLSKTFTALQDETGIALNTVPSMEAFISDVMNGEWERVITTTNTLQLPSHILFDLYEHITLEMLELKEIDVARRLLRSTKVMNLLALQDRPRHSRLEALAARTFYTSADLYLQGETRESRRRALSNALSEHVTTVPSARLLTLISHAVKWQKHTGLLPRGEKVDIFRGLAQEEEDLEENPPEVLAKNIKFGKTAPETAVFSHSGAHLVTGSLDGFIEVWNPETGKIRKDLEYQKDGDYMSHDNAVLALGFSLDGEMLASCCQGGVVKIWKISTGQCMRFFNKAHTAGITSVQFAKDGGSVLTASFDGTARIHGIKSGKVALKEFREHTSYVNSAVFNSDGGKVVTASSDGTVKIWDTRSMKCLKSVSPSGVSAADPPPCYSAAYIPGTENVVICNRSPLVTIVSTRDGHIVKQLKTDDNAGLDFVACTLSPKANWLYCIADDKKMHCFEVKTGRVRHALEISEKETVGVAHHPHRNCVATWGLDATVKLWIPKPSQ